MEIFFLISACIKKESKRTGLRNLFLVGIDRTDKITVLQIKLVYLGRIDEEGNDNPLQYLCLENLQSMGSQESGTI